MPEYEPVWEVIAGHDPRATLFLGDNVYIDDPEDVRWTGDYCYARRHSRPEWKKLTAKTSIHAIYDDHDFGMDDCIPGALIDLPPWKKPVLENFKKNWNNPMIGGGQENPGCWQSFSMGQVQFIMLDCRYYRDRNEKSMLGDFQKNGSRRHCLIRMQFLKLSPRQFRFLKESNLEVKTLGMDIPKKGRKSSIL